MIYTFYSFKGGVGRSMAMAGVAYLLARRGLKVLTIDFDLEAPGLERYFFGSERAVEVRRQPGLMDLIKTYRLALTSEAEFQEGRFRNWRQFVFEALPRVENDGCVHIMTAGCREPDSALREYAASVRGFDWQDFFDNWKGEAFFAWLRSQLLDAYDLVLVDSRTGVTEMGGVCAYQLADVAVMLCAANHQNLDGTMAVARDFRSDAVIALRRGRPLEILVVPARLEDNNTRRDDFLADFSHRLGSDYLPHAVARAGLDYASLAVRYDPEFAVIERLVDDPASAARAERNFTPLARAIMLLANREGKLNDLRASIEDEVAGGAEGVLPTQYADPTRRSAGYDAFIDYRGRDRQAAAMLATRLEEAGLRIWFDAQAMERDSNWQQSADRALDESEWLVVLIGDEVEGLTNQVSSLRGSLLERARRLGRPRIVPVMIGGEPDWRRLAQYGLQDINALVLGPLPGDESALRELTALLRSSVGRNQQANAEVDTESADPYPGDCHFDEEHAPFFHGRDDALQELLSALDRNDIVRLEGAAGVGKTSLVQAGLIPWLRRQAGESNAAPWTIDYRHVNLPEALELDAGSSTPEGNRLLVLDHVDSFPMAGSYAQRRSCFNALARLIATAGPQNKVLVVARHLGEEEQSDLFPSPAYRLELFPMAADAIRAAIEKPATRLGHLLEPGLTERLIAQAGGSPSAIAQIQRVLPALWRDRRRGWLTNKALESAGGIGGAFATAIADWLGKTAPGIGAAYSTLVRRLVEMDGALRLSPRPADWAALCTVPALADDPVALRDQLAAHHFIDLWWRGPIEGDLGGMTCALAVTAATPYLAEFARPDDAEFFLWRRRLETLLDAWHDSGFRDDDLLTGGTLAEAERHAKDHRAELTAAEYDFIERSLTTEASRQGEAARIERQRIENDEIRAARAAAEAERDRASAALAGEEAARAEAAQEATKARQWTKRAGILALLMALLAGGLALLWKENDTERRRSSLAATVSIVQANTNLDPTAAAVALSKVLADPSAPAIAKEAIFGFQNQVLARSVLRGHTGAVTHAAFSLDGRRIITASNDGTARLWHADGSPVAELKGHNGPIRHSAFSPDGQSIVTASDDDTARLWSADGSLIVELKGHTGSIRQAEFSPDGRRIVTASSDGTARLWHADGSPDIELKGHSGPIRHATFSPDGLRIITASLSSTARLWRADGKPVAELRGHTRSVIHAAFSPDGQHIVTASSDGTARLWRADGSPVAELKGHTRSVLRATFSPDGLRIVTASSDGTARLWRADGSPVAELKGHTGRVAHAAFSPDGLRIVTASEDNTTRLWRANGDPVAELKGHTGSVWHAAFSPDSLRIVTASEDNIARLWQADGSPVAELKGHSDSVWRAAFSPDGQLILTASNDSTARLWRADGSPITELKGHTNTVNHGAFSPKGQRIVTGSDDGTARLWNSDGSPIAELKGHSGPIRHVAFSPDGQRIVTASWDETARLWSADGSPVAELKGHTGRITHAAFSPNGQHIATASADNTARLWRADGTPIAELMGHTNAITHAAFSPDGQHIATASADKTARLWRTDGTTVAELKGHTNTITHAAFSPDGQHIVTASSDGTARLWRSDGSLRSELKGHAGSVWQAVFSPDGQRIVTASDDNTTRLWPVGSQAFIERIKVFAEPCLDTEQRQRFFFEERDEAVKKAEACFRTKANPTTQ